MYEEGHGRSSGAAAPDARGYSKIEDNLAFIPASRRDAVRTRIKVLDAYLSLDPPSAADAVASAEQIGVALSTFYALARVWRTRRDPKDLIGAGNRRGTRAPKVHGDEDFIERALREIPRDRTVEEDVVALVKLASAQGVKLRSISALRKKVRELRSDGGLNAVNEDLVIGQVAVMLPVEHVDGAILPVATVLVDPRRERLLAVRLGIEAASAADVADALLYDIRAKAIVECQPGIDKRVETIALGGDQSADWSRLAAILEKQGLRVTERTPRARTDAAALCSKLLLEIGFKARPRMGSWLVDRRRAKHVNGLSAPVPLEEAQAAVDAQMAAAGKLPQACLVASADVIDLALGLRSSADRGTGLF